MADLGVDYVKGLLHERHDVMIPTIELAHESKEVEFFRQAEECTVGLESIKQVNPSP